MTGNFFVWNSCLDPEHFFHNRNISSTIPTRVQAVVLWVFVSTVLLGLIHRVATVSE